MALSLLSILAVVFVGIGNAYLYAELSGKPFPGQPILPLIKSALTVNPAVTWLSVAVVIPLVEEILFRGLLFGALQKHWGLRAAVWGSALVFVVVHLQIIVFLPLFFLGLILAWARLKTGSIGLPILLHGLNNAIGLAVLVFAPSASTS
jgi:membrane protease YdiL (CAAX protease family)